MKKTIYILTLLLLQGLFTIAQNQESKEKSVFLELHVVNAGIFSELYQNQVNFYDLLYQKSSEYPKKLYDKYFLLQLYLRAGLPQKAKEVVDDIIINFPNLSSSTIDDLYSQTSNFSYPTITNAVINAYGNSIMLINKNHLIYDEMRDSRYYRGIGFMNNLYKKEGWSIKKIEKWIQSLSGLSNNDKINYKVLFYKSIEKENKIKKIAKQFSRIIWNNKNDIDKFMENLETICYTKGRNFDNYGIDLSWVSKEIIPTYSTDALKIAKYLSWLGYKDQMEHFYQIALSIELTEKDYKYLNSLRNRRVSNHILNVSYKLSLRETLSKILLDRGAKKESHAMMLESVELSKQNHIPPNMFFAGNIQRGTGIYYVEQELLENEVRLTDSIEYWKDRYNYYLGRKELENAKYAIVKGINLLKNKYHNDTIYLIKDYQYFINNQCFLFTRQQRYEEALKGYVKGLNYSVTSYWAKSIIADIVRYFEPKQIDIWEKVFWKYLSENDYWNEDFIRLLLAGGSSLQEKELVLNKLDSLADNSPIRSFNLALSVYESYPEEAIKHFEFARINYPDVSYYGERNREESAKKLVNLYLDSGNMKKAESVLQEMESKYIEYFVVSNLRNMSLSAAKNRNFEESLRLWSIIQNINPSDTEYLSELCKNGMSELLTEYSKYMTKIEKYKFHSSFYCLISSSQCTTIHI